MEKSNGQKLELSICNLDDPKGCVNFIPGDENETHLWKVAI